MIKLPQVFLPAFQEMGWSVETEACRSFEMERRRIWQCEDRNRKP
jgi:hypothetical protein